MMNLNQETVSKKIATDESLDPASRRIAEKVADAIVPELSAVMLDIQKAIRELSGAKQGSQRFANEITEGIYGKATAQKLQKALGEAHTVSDARRAFYEASEDAVKEMNLEGVQRPMVHVERRTLIAAATAAAAAVAGISAFATRKLSNRDKTRVVASTPEGDLQATLTEAHAERMFG